MLTVTVGDAPAALRASVLAMRQADSEIRRGVSARMRGELNPVWKAEVAKRAGGGLAAKVLNPGTRITGGNPPQLIAASSKRKIGNGLVPDRHWAGYEHGANDSTRVLTSTKGKRYKRHVMRHLPGRGPGRALEPAAREVLPRVASFYAQSVIKLFMDAVETGQN
ncbi:MAG: hypothetical protein QM582_14065 [Micropruina sp.]|uniref:hypothetical protein n=1 Tax=Micropruina sp. TaxID=2737536 RepID=UPI0039E36468